MQLLIRDNAPVAKVRDGHRPSDGEVLVPDPGHQLDHVTPEIVSALLAGETPPAPWHFVPRLVIVERLDATTVQASDGSEVNALEAALDALDQDRKLKARWEAAQEVRSDDQQVRGLVEQIGADPDAILARPEA